MATFTVELRKVVGRGVDIGKNDYPIFDESYRPKLNKSIVEHFWYREIGFETIDMFINRFEQRMNLIMPVYNKLYLSTLMEYDPLSTTKMVTDSEGSGKDTGQVDSTNTSTASNASTTGAKARTVGSDFPQTMLSDEGDYATSANDSVSDTTTGATSTDEAAQATTQVGDRESASHTTMEGYTRSPAELVMMYRDTLINVDAMLIADLEPLFMQVWNTADEYGDYPSIHPFNSFFGGMYL